MSNRVVTKIVRTKRNTGTTERLRHAARTPEQEYKRDVEMREALKAAKEQAEKAWWTWQDIIPKGLSSQERAAWMEARICEHGDLRALETVARAAARKTLRERWARESAASTDPLAPNLVRMAPDDLHDGNALIEARKAYLAEVQKLGSGARGNEQKRLMKAWQKIDAERRALDRR